MSDFVFREALPEDKGAVLGIREVNLGIDYLHNVYDEFQKSSHISSYLCEVNEELVGFVSMTNVDKGETVIDRAARVRQDFEGKGVYRFLLTEVDKIHKKKGNVKRHALITSYKLPAPNQLIREQAINNYTFTIVPGTTERMENLLQTEESMQLSEELPRTALFSDYASYLFPQNRMVIGCLPFRILDTNIPLIPRSRFASTLHEDSDGTISGLLSASSAYKGTKEYDIISNIDVFGADMGTLEDHVAVHLRFLLEREIGSVFLRIVSEPNIKLGILDKIFRKLGAEHIVSGPLFTPIFFLYERNIEH